MQKRRPSVFAKGDALLCLKATISRRIPVMGADDDHCPHGTERSALRDGAGIAPARNQGEAAARSPDRPQGLAIWQGRRNAVIFCGFDCHKVLCTKVGSPPRGLAIARLSLITAKGSEPTPPSYVAAARVRDRRAVSRCSFMILAARSGSRVRIAFRIWRCWAL